MDIIELAQSAKIASVKLAAATGEIKNKALAAIATALKENAAKIIAANESDLTHAKAEGLAVPLLKRLKFDQAKINDVCAGLESLIGIAEPVGQTLSALELDKGLELYKVSCPIGVIGVIFESRPDALVQISTLCLKSGNACLLKGGSEAAETNKILAEIIAVSAETSGIPTGWLGLLETRSDVAEMLGMDEYIDLVIPRGSNEFVKYIMDNTNIAVLGHADGICHVYIDAAADIGMAVNIAVDSKCQYCAVCNAVETLLVHEVIAGDFLPRAKTAFDKKGVQIRGCEKTQAIIDCQLADEQDWKTEYLDDIISIKVVADFSKAIAHINRYGSGHTDCVVTSDAKCAADFMNLVDSADVFWNASTRFSDGFRFGLGAEVGVSTTKIHARGPVGIEGLLIYKYKLIGNGQIVANYSGDDGKKFIHKKIEKNFGI
ncbi:MAG: glutamate-5-semialdehyde dehydrogenase [Anaerohalosphaeraceae bacterium]|nr:glutamate-5-semialdehyde dehydrogenase [Anaerohalosphaeraceae bacterium]